MVRPAALLAASRPRRGLLAAAPPALAALLAGCGATGANLAETDGGGRKWWSPPAALAKAVNITPPGLTADPVPSSREELENPAALDLAYANLKTGGVPSESAREDAKAAYERVLEDDPANVDALIGLAYLTETGAGDRPGELDAAEDAYLQAADAAPRDARPQLALGRYHAARGRWGESAAAYGRAAELTDDTKQRRDARHGLALATARGGDIEGARPHFVASVGEASAHYNVGSLYLAQGDRDAAEREYRLAVSKDTGGNPQLQQAHAALAALTAGRSDARLAAAPKVSAPAAPAADPFAANPLPTVTPAAAIAASARVAPAVFAPAAAPVAPPAAAPTPAIPPADPAAPPPWPF